MVHVNIPVPWSICETSLGEARSTGGTETLETVGDHSHSQPNNGNKKHDISRNVLLEHSWNQRFLFFKNFLFLKSFGRWLAIWISPTNPTKKNWSLFFLLKRSRGSRTMSFLIVFHVDVVEANFRMLEHAKPPQIVWWRVWKNFRFEFAQFLIRLCWGESTTPGDIQVPKNTINPPWYFFSKAVVFADISAWIGWLLVVGFFFPSWPTEMVESEWPRLVSNFQKWNMIWKTVRSAGESTSHFTQCRGKAQGTKEPKHGGTCEAK